MSCQDRMAGWGFRCDLIERNQLWYSLWRYASGVELEPYLMWQMKWVYHHITGTVRSPARISRGLDRVSGTIWLWFNGQGCQIPSDRSWPGLFTLRTRDHNSTICSTLVSLCPFSPCTQTGILRKEDPLVTRLPWSQKDNSDRIPNDNASGMIEHREHTEKNPLCPGFSLSSHGNPSVDRDWIIRIVIATIASEINDGINISFVIGSHCEWKRTTVEMQLWNFALSRTLVVRWNVTPVLFLPSLPPYIYSGKQKRSGPP